MRPFLDELQATLDCGIWSPAVLGLLVIPDACGAIEFPLLKNGDRYKKWYDKYVRACSYSNFRFDGEVLWKLRNGMMHETSLNLSAYGYDRVMFTTPNRNNNIIHMCLTANNGGVSESALTVYLPQFFADLRQATEQWLSEIENDIDPDRRDRLGKLVQLRPFGLSPHILGLPLVA